VHASGFGFAITQAIFKLSAGRQPASDIALLNARFGGYFAFRAAKLAVHREVPGNSFRCL
jgi:hypothetical protein